MGHLFTEAERSYRNSNGMEHENGIRAFGFINGLDKSAIYQIIQESYRARERYWLTQILKEEHMASFSHMRS
ncbi:hypothetical protein SAMN05421863_101468 [Nitrosomonas communis]|uniref:Uncharacterized protein n=2 Tax=Nitrosomonas communis TaxID=44574 RepID=A0A1I4NE13_9PROT|nr:hypothetical protein SAMN05421863_101468 [Nitrosomonas communis]